MPAEPTTAQVRRNKKEVDEFPFKVSGHAREIEQKRARGEVSCAECRRLKIKCSKEIPCSSCIRRGCRTICPQGSLATGEGTRYVLAATEHLHRKISKLSTRVRELEDALAAVHRENSDDPHPLLREEAISAPMEIADAAEESDSNEADKQSVDTIETFGTLRISEHGVSRFFGSAAGSEVLLMTMVDQNDEESPVNSPSPPSAHGDYGPSSTVSFFSRAFPFTPLGSVDEAQNLIESYLPNWDRSHQLCRCYFSHVSWLIKSVSPSQILDDMLPVIYSQKESRPGEEYDTPHHLALLFVILALGALVEGTTDPQEGFNNIQEAEHFHQIAKAALPLQPILEKPSIYAIQALHLMSVYNAMSGEDLASQNSMEMTWNLVTLASHLAQTIGLHRDSARWGLQEQMTQRRRTIFWDLYTADTWNSLATGRPPSFTLAYIDCKLPEYPGNLGKETNKLAFENWHLKFTMDCVSEVASKACAALAPSYESIMELDKKVREYPLPDLTGKGKPEMVVDFQRCICDHIRETVLLYIHRSFFAQAIIDEPSNPLKSTYAPSFLAAYRASTQILHAIRDQYALFPSACARWWVMWSYAFSASVVFGMVVTKGPGSPLANAAMKELDEACILFSKVAASSRRAAKALPILARLNTKARAALAAAKNNSDVGAAWVLNDDNDELAIFAGHTRLVSNKQQAADSVLAGVGYSSTPVPLSLPPQAQNLYTSQQPTHNPRRSSELSHNSPYPRRAQETQFVHHEQPPSTHLLSGDHRELPQLRTYSPWPSPSQSQIPHHSPHPEASSSIPTPISATAREGIRRFDASPYGWAPDTMSSSPHEEHRRPSDSSARHYSRPDYEYPMHPSRTNAPMPQMYPAGGTSFGMGGYNEHPRVSQPPSSPMDLTGMGIVSPNSRLDEQFLSFMNDSGILAPESEEQHRPQQLPQHHPGYNTGR